MGKPTETTDEFDYEEQGKKEEPAKEADEVSLEQKANELAGQLVKDDSGKLTLPDGVEASEELLIAAKSIKRHRDTQSEYTKERQKSIRLETSHSKLTDYIIQNASLDLTEEQQDELDELKIQDPDEWRKKITQYEEDARKAHESRIKEFDEEGTRKSELELRQDAYQKFREDTGLELSDEIIANDLPASYSKKLESGEITFDQFLNQAKEFLTKGVKIKGSDAQPKKHQPDLSNLPGGREPESKSNKADIVASYDDEIY